MKEQERQLEGDYATIYELALHETTQVKTEFTEGKNSYNLFTQTLEVTRVHGGWIYTRYAGSHGPQTTFVPDTRPAEVQQSANRPRQ